MPVSFLDTYRVRVGFPLAFQSSRTEISDHELARQDRAVHGAHSA